MADFIQITDDGDVQTWQFKHPETGRAYDSTFRLRIVPSDLQRVLRRKYTKFEFVRGQRNEVLDWAAFMDDCLDHAIVGWSDVKSKGIDIPCERRFKLLLPEAVKQEIIRLCVGKELGTEAAPESSAVIVAGATDEDGVPADPQTAR